MSFFSRLLRSRNSAPAAAAPLLVDMHSHLLPGIDDGVETFEEAITLIRELMQMGYRKCITTPHIMGDFYTNGPHNILPLCAELNERIKAEGLDFEVEAAAEYYLDEYFAGLLAKGELLTFGDKYILLETSFLNPAPNLNEIIFNLIIAGYKPILAHPERYVYLFDDFNKYYDIRDRGILFQVNLASLAGYYSRESKKIAERLIREGLVQFLGTDLHNARHLKPLQDAMKTPSFALATNSKIRNNQLLGVPSEK